MKTFARQLGKGALWGAALGLAFFALEAVWLLQTDAVGLKVEQTGPFAALFAVIRRLLPPVIARVVLGYLLGGAVFGVVAAALARGFTDASGWKHRAAWLGSAVGLTAAVVLGHAVDRPALFDDLPRLRPLLLWAVDHGQPWHARAALAALVGPALLSCAWRRRTVRTPWVPLGGATAALVLLVLLTGTIPHAATQRAPRVVLIGVDAFRPDRLAALGGRRGVAPNLDALAREATLFTQAYTPIAQTEPAWRSLLTARWPNVTGDRYPLTAAAHQAELPTFTGTLKAAGVATVFATDCSRFHHEGERSGFEQRWQPPKGAINFALEKLRFRGTGLWGDNAFGAWLLPEFVDNRALAGIHDPTGYAHRLASRMVDALRPGSGLFAWHSTAAHFPGDPSFPHYRQFVDPRRPLDRRLRMQFSPIGAGKVVPSADWGRDDSEALYDELLAQSDAQVGILFDALKANGLWDETTVIVFSDHGESFHADRPELAGSTPVHGARLTQEENQILLLVKPAGGRKVETVDALVRLVDVGPTILEALSLAPLASADGQSLGGLLRGEAESARMLYAETGYTHASPTAFDAAHLAIAPRTFDAYAVREDGSVEMTDAAHAAAIAEKDLGAFDGKDWLIQHPQADGSVTETCTGRCEALKAFLQQAKEEHP